MLLYVNARDVDILRLQLRIDAADVGMREHHREAVEVGLRPAIVRMLVALGAFEPHAEEGRGDAEGDLLTVDDAAFLAMRSMNSVSTSAARSCDQTGAKV